jgi:uncharacterized membrane protein
MKLLRFDYNKTFTDWLPYITIYVFGFLYFIIVFCNHYFFRTWTYDYGSYNFAFYDYAHFRISESPVLMPHVSFLQDHVSFTLMLFAPFYWMLSWLTGTYTLALLQTLIILAGGLALYKLLELKTSNRPIALLALLQYFTLYGRWASFCTACNLAIIASSSVPVLLYYFEKKKFLAAYLILGFILLSREDMALWTVFIGLFLLLSHIKEKDFRCSSVMIIVASIGYFLLVFTVIIPLLETPYKKFSLFNYSVLGTNPYEALISLLKHPVKCIELLFVNHSGDPAYDNVKKEFYFDYLLSGGFLLLYRPKYIILLIPLIFKKMYNDLPVRWSIESYYSIELVSFLPFAVFMIIAGIKHRLTRQIVTVIVCLNSLLVTTYKLYEKGRILNYDNTNFAFYRSSMYKTDFEVKSVYRNLDLIPRDAVISASNSINPHVAFRPKAYFFPRVYEAEYIAVFRKRDTWPYNQEQYNARINKYMLSEEWEIKVDDGTLLILEKRKEGRTVR